MTQEELNTQIQAEVKEVIVESSKVIKKYIDDNSIQNPDVRAKVEEEIANSIAKKYDFENEKSKLDEASKVAEVLLGLFDTDESGDITPEEFMNKLNSIYAELETTNKLSDDLQNLVDRVSSIYEELKTSIANVDGRVTEVSNALSNTNDTLAQVKTNIETNFFTKDEVSSALTINKDEILDEVKEVFGIVTEDNGDGATL
jgi:chromosome segregation ATPase